MRPNPIPSFPLCATVALALTVAAQAQQKVTFDDHIAPVFTNACNNCHNPDKKKAGLDLTTYAATLQGSENGKILNPGNAEASLLWKCVKQIEEPKMPPKGEKLTDAEIDLIKNWIAGFALENATGKPAAPTQNKVSAAVVSLEKPDGPPPMPGELPLEPIVRTGKNNALTALAASPWAPLVAVGGQKQVLLYHTETLAPLGVLPFPEGFPTVLRFSRNGKLLLTGGGLGGKLGKVVLWDIATGERVGTVGNETDQVLGADLSPDHQHVALGGPTRVLKIYSTKDGKLLHSIKKHTDWVTAVCFSPDGRYLASADRAGGVVVWEGATGREFNTLAGHKAPVTALAFMPGVLASASTDGKIVLWEVKEGKEIRNWAAHGGGVESVDFTPDGRLVSCGRDKVAKAWDQTGKVLATSEAFGDIALRAVLNSGRVVAGDWTGDIRVFGLDGKRLGQLTANPPSIAEQLAAAQKRGTDAQASIAGLQQALTAAEQKVQAELAAAQQRQKDAQAALDAARAVIPQIEKRVAEEKALFGSLNAARDVAAKALDTARAALNAKPAATTPPADLEAAKKDLETKTAAVEEAKRKLTEHRDKAAKTEAEWKDARNTQPAKIAAAEKAVQEAHAHLASVQPAAPAAALLDAAQIAETKKKLEAAKAEVEKLRQARGAQKEGTPEYKAADDKVQAKKAEIAKAEAQVAPPPPAPALSPARQELAKAKAALDAANVQVLASRAETERWTRAQVFMTVHKARETYAEKKARHEDLVQTAKDAFVPVERAKAQIAALEKSVAEAPAKLKEAEAQLAQAMQTRDTARQAVTDTQVAATQKENAVAEGKKAEAEVAELTKKLTALNTEIGKRREARGKLTEGTPDYAKADALVQGIKPEIERAEAGLAAAKAKQPRPELAAELTAAQEAAKAAASEAKLAADKAAAAEKNVAKVKQAGTEAAQQLATLQKNLPALTTTAAAAKEKAEMEANVAAKYLEEAKAEAERARADYEKRYQPAGKKVAGN
jgi:chromosome segregation ATPase